MLALVFGGSPCAVVQAHAASIRSACRADGAVRKIHEAFYAPIGGIEQWIQIRGRNRANPVILVLHGGPGSTWDPLTQLFAAWEEQFVMVYWSQRGAGKTYRKTGPKVAATMTIDRMVQDGIEVTDFIRQHLQKDSLILLAHSWGTVLGVNMVQRQPDLYAAYVGTGQVVNMLEDERAGLQEVLRRARLAGRADAVEELQSLGEPPYDDINKMVVERKWAGVFDTPSDAAFNSKWKNPAGFSVADAEERSRAWLFSNLTMFGQKRQDGPVMGVDFATSALKFDVPMIFIQGEDDHITPTSLVDDYVHRISAPKVVLVRLPGGGHNAVTTMPNIFLREMMRQLGPLSHC